MAAFGVDLHRTMCRVLLEEFHVKSHVGAVGLAAAAQDYGQKQMSLGK